MQRSRREATLAILLVCLLPVIAPGQSEPPLVKQVAEANSATIQSIRSFSCRYSRAILPATESNEIYNAAEQDEGRYWRSNGVIRVSRPLPDGRTNELLVRDGRVWSLNVYGHKNPPQRYLAVGRYQCLDRGDVEEFVLLTHFVGGNTMRNLHFSELLEQPLNCAPGAGPVTCTLLGQTRSRYHAACPSILSG
jgi:hypothetical protein